MGLYTNFMPESIYRWVEDWSYKPGSNLHIEPRHEGSQTSSVPGYQVFLTLSVPSSREPDMVLDKVPTLERFDYRGQSVSEWADPLFPTDPVRIVPRSPRQIQVTTTRFLEGTDVACQYPEAFYQWVWENLVQPLETHESAEWFRVKGKIYDDPHNRSNLLRYGG